MGIDGERLVLDYLSKVGDLAHGTSLSAVERRELVTQLRDEIGRKRSQVTGSESNADVKRILRGMGRPEDVVAAAGSGEADPAPAVPAPSAAGATATAAETAAEQGVRSPRVPESGGAQAPGGVPAARLAPEDLVDADAPEPPAGHSPDPAAGTLGAPHRARRGEYWPDGRIGGFVGGIEEPEMLRPPGDEPAPGRGGAVPLEKESDGADPDGKEGGAAAGTAEQSAKTAGPGKKAGKERPPRTGPGLLRRGLGGRHAGGVVEFLAVLVLVAGAFQPSFYLLIGGWLLAYWSPRLSPRIGQWTVLGMPGLVLGGYLTWIYGRANGHWGDPVEGDAFQTALSDNYPSLLRLAGLASAAFLLAWAMRRPKG